MFYLLASHRRLRRRREEVAPPKWETRQASCHVLSPTGLGK